MRRHRLRHRRPTAQTPTADGTATYREMKALRHSFATWALEGDAARGIHAEPITRVRDWMGHSSVEETERYAHVNRMGSTDSLDALGDDLA
jgi:integrase